MKRMLLAAAGVLAIGAAGVASTASNSLPPSTAGYQAVTVTGATMNSIGYTVTANTITGFTLQLSGQVLLGTTQLIAAASAHFGSNAATPCTVGLYNLTTNQTPVTCTGFTQPANASWTLTVSIS